MQGQPRHATNNEVLKLLGPRSDALKLCSLSSFEASDGPNKYEEISISQSARREGCKIGQDTRRNRGFGSPKVLRIYKQYRC